MSLNSPMAPMNVDDHSRSREVLKCWRIRGILHRGGTFCHTEEGEKASAGEPKHITWRITNQNQIHEQTPSTFQKFALSHFTFRKDRRQYLFFFFANLKKSKEDFYFYKRRQKQKRHSECVSRRIAEAASTPHTAGAAGPGSPGKRAPHLSIWPGSGLCP